MEHAFNDDAHMRNDMTGYMEARIAADLEQLAKICPEHWLPKAIAYGHAWYNRRMSIPAAWRKAQEYVDGPHSAEYPGGEQVWNLTHPYDVHNGPLNTSKTSTFVSYEQAIMERNYQLDILVARLVTGLKS